MRLNSHATNCAHCGHALLLRFGASTQVCMSFIRAKLQRSCWYKVHQTWVVNSTWVSNGHALFLHYSWLYCSLCSLSDSIIFTADFLFGRTLLGMSVFPWNNMALLAHTLKWVFIQWIQWVVTTLAATGGKKVGQGRCHADINNSVEMVRALGEVWDKVGSSNLSCPVCFLTSNTLHLSFTVQNYIILNLLLLLSYSCTVKSTCWEWLARFINRNFVCFIILFLQSLAVG